MRAGGQVVCWLQDSDDPVGAAIVVAGVEHAVQVATGDNFACARLADRRVSCWGAEYEGQLGRGTITTEGPGMRMRANPTKRLPPAPIATLRDVRAIAAGVRYACALLADGTAACWGRQDAAFVTLAGPAAVPGPAHVTALAVGPHACALRGEHEVACWGPGLSGELGTGWSRTMPTPRDVPGLTDATAVSRTCALRATGRVACWGADAARRYLPPTEIPKLEHVVGLARPEAEARPYRITTVDAAGIVRELFDTSRKLAVPAAAAIATRCAVTRAGHVWCWPDTHVDAGGTTVVGPAREVPGITNAIAVAEGHTHACVSRAGGAVTCLFGQPGLHRDKPRTVDAGGGAHVRALGVGLRQDCVIRADRTVWCWDWDVSAIFQNAESPVVPDAPVIAPHAVGVTASPRRSRSPSAGTTRPPFAPTARPPAGARTTSGSSGRARRTATSSEVSRRRPCAGSRTRSPSTRASGRRARCVGQAPSRAGATRSAVRSVHSRRASCRRPSPWP